MSLAVEKLKPASKRTQFVRMTFAYAFAADLGSYTVVNNGGLGTWNVYEVSLPAGFDALEVVQFDLGAEDPLTEKASLSLIDGWNTWTHDPSTSRLYVALESIPDPVMTPLVVRFRMFFKTGADLRWYGTPTDDATSQQLWRGRVAQPLSATQGITDLFAGIFSFNETNFSLVDHDGLVHGLLGYGRTVNNLAVDVWQCVGEINKTNFARLFRGRLKEPTLAPLSVAFSAYDEFSILDKTATFGEDEDGHVYVPTTSVAKDIGKPIPIPLGFESYSELRTILSPTDYPPLKTLVAGTEAYVETYSSTISTSNNRTWLAARGFNFETPIGPGVGTFGTINRVLNTGFGYWALHVSSLPSNLAPGQSFVWDQSGLHYSTVRSVTAFSLGGDAYNLVIDRLGSHTLTTSADPFEEQCGGLALVINGMENYPDGLNPVYGRDYTVSSVSSTFTKLVKITFASNFEANFAGSETLDPEKHKVEWAQKSVVSGTAYRHGSVLLRLLQQAGLDIGDGSTFTTANTALAENVYMMIPRRGEGVLGSYRSYIEPILRGSFGYLAVNDDDKVEYHLFAAPAAGDTYGDDVHGGIECTLETQDIKTIIAFTNPDLAEASGATVKNATYRGPSRTVYGTDVEETLTHALGPTNTVGRASQIVAVKAAPRTVYRLDVPGMRAIDKGVGDDLTIRGTRLPGGQTTKNVKIIQLVKNQDSVQVMAYGLEALS